MYCLHFDGSSLQYCDVMWKPPVPCMRFESAAAVVTRACGPKKLMKGMMFISETTVLGREELDLEDPTPRETQSQTYRCEIVPPEAVVQEGSMVHGFYLPPWEVDFQNFKRFLELQQQNPVSLSKMQKAALRDWCSMSIMVGTTRP